MSQLEAAETTLVSIYMGICDTGIVSIALWQKRPDSLDTQTPVLYPALDILCPNISTGRGKEL